MQPCQPAGITPASLWYAPGTPAPIRAIPQLAPDEDAATGRIRSLEGQGDPVLVALGQQLRTARGTGASVAEDGTDLFSITKQTEDAPALIEFEMQRVLKPFVDDGVITAEPPDVTAGPDAGNTATVLERVKLKRGGATPAGVL